LNFEGDFDQIIESTTDKTVPRVRERMSTTLTVSGMACDGCERNVEEAIESVPGVERVDADHDAGRVTVEGDADVDALVSAIDEAGYEAAV
jgi:copper chaperone CopZ